MTVHHTHHFKAGTFWLDAVFGLQRRRLNQKPIRWVQRWERISLLPTLLFSSSVDSLHLQTLILFSCDCLFFFLFTFPSSYWNWLLVKRVYMESILARSAQGQPNTLTAGHLQNLGKVLQCITPLLQLQWWLRLTPLPKSAKPQPPEQDLLCLPCLPGTCFSKCHPPERHQQHPALSRVYQGCLKAPFPNKQKFGTACYTFV